MPAKYAEWQYIESLDTGYQGQSGMLPAVSSGRQVSGEDGNYPHCFGWYGHHRALSVNKSL